MLRLFFCCSKMLETDSEQIITPNIGPECMTMAEKFTFDGRQMICYIPSIDIYDGDTFIAVTRIEGWTNPVKLRCRIKGIDTSEVRGGTAATKQLGLKAREYLKGLIGDKTLAIDMGAFDMYGRVLVDIVLPGTGVSLAETMVLSEHAIRYDGRGAKKDDMTN